MAKRVAIVTGSRSDRGLLEPLVKPLDAGVIDLQELECLPNSDTLTGTCTAMGLVQTRLPTELLRREVGMVVLLGDRYEVLQAAICAHTLGIPIAHIEGSDTTLGSLDEGYRKCIRALATLHFDVEEYGSLGCVFPEYSDDKNLFVGAILIYHPWKGNWKQELINLVSVMEKEPNTLAITSNNDAGGKKINKILEESCISYCTGLPRAQYIDLLGEANFIIGNSSSGIIEAPSLKTPTINVGDRQKGRMRAASVIDCKGDADSIRMCIEEVGADFFKDSANWDIIKNPYKKKNTVERIVSGIEEHLL